MRWYFFFYWIWRTWPKSGIHYKVHRKNLLLNRLKQPTGPSPFSRLAVNKTKVIKPNLISARLSPWFESRIITFGPSHLRSHNTISSTCLLWSIPEGFHFLSLAPKQRRLGGVGQSNCDQGRGSMRLTSKYLAHKKFDRPVLIFTSWWI